MPEAGDDAAWPWWRDAVVYQVYPRSYADSDGDGVGDLEGLRRRLDHLAWLGVDAVWLSPIFRSPMADFGYDVSDYTDVDPVFGTLADADRLIAEAHERGIKVMLDWVPNHSSDQHPWFRERPDFYVWREGSPDRPPNNWGAAFGSYPAWTWSAERQAWYLHLFLPQQPDLDWSNPEVPPAMHDTLRFWLDRGVDGFRMDVVHCIGKDRTYADLPPEQANAPVVVNDVPETHEHLRGIRRVLDEYDGHRTSVGEVYLLDTAKVATYYGTADEPELHMSFNFPALWERWDAEGWRRRIDDVERHLAGDDTWPTWVLSNHDVPRHRVRYGSEERARAAAVLLLTLRGTPFLYAGEELALEDAVVPDERRVDPGGRDGCRAPIPWEEAAPHGWEGADPWLPFPPDAGARSVAAQRADEGSVLHLYRRLLAARRGSPALRRGGFRWLEAPAGVLAYERRAGDDVRRVVVNMGEEEASVAGLLDGWEVEAASGPVGEQVLPADVAVVCRPR